MTAPDASRSAAGHQRPAPTARTPVPAAPTAMLAMLAVFAAAVLSTTVLSGCGAHPDTRDELLVGAAPATVAVQARTVPGLGRVLTDGQGRTLYMFPPDAGSRVSCTGPCAGTWPALAATGTHPTAGPGVDRALLGTRPDPNRGGNIVTYSGYPLYRYAGDTTAGTANGQALFLDGGPWYALTPAGNPVTITPRAAALKTSR